MSTVRATHPAWALPRLRTPSTTVSHWKITMTTTTTTTARVTSRRSFDERSASRSKARGDAAATSASAFTPSP